MEYLDKYIIEYHNHTEKDFMDVWKIESEYLKDSTISSVKQTIDWDNKNHDIHIFVRDKEVNKIVGEITLLPLSEKQFQNFMKDRLHDAELDVLNLLTYEEKCLYYLLFSAIAIDKDYRTDRLVLSYLLKGLYNKINDLRNRKVRFRNMCAEGQTKDGQKFLESFLNLTQKNTTKEGYKLYSFNNEEEMNKWINIFPEYIEKYDQTLTKYKIKKKR